VEIWLLDDEEEGRNINRKKIFRKSRLLSTFFEYNIFDMSTAYAQNIR